MGVLLEHGQESFDGPRMPEQKGQLGMPKNVPYILKPIAMVHKLYGKYVFFSPYLKGRL